MIDTIMDENGRRSVTSAGSTGFAGSTGSTGSAGYAGASGVAGELAGHVVGNRGVVHRGFPPLCGCAPHVLILGTFPSPLSREKNEYYGNPRNQFWRIMQFVYGEPFADVGYERRKAFLYANGVAVWDVIKECEADGALDSTIRNPVYNIDIPVFVAENGIGCVYFNGNNAYMFYKRGIGDIGKNVLPSSSPAYAAVSVDRKALFWREALKGR
ncbi:MAG: DNA-deoxyinosine glycosylase [Oscillospiraceae bacterium]|nr:DNA-deoxyinosine glycosylase [Oscillospiraceae bacterium]